VADSAAVAEARRILGAAHAMIIGRGLPTAAEIAFERSAAPPTADVGAGLVRAR
jgi:hypothetical protein